MEDLAHFFKLFVILFVSSYKILYFFSIFLLSIQLSKSRRRLELLLEDLPCEYESWDYYETSEQLLKPLLLCYDSLVLSCYIIITPFSYKDDSDISLFLY